MQSSPPQNGDDAACEHKQSEGTGAISRCPSGTFGARGAPTALRRAASIGSGGKEGGNVLEEREIDHCESFAISSAGP